eukprot:TRINITY_DN5381_c0_g1_i2.p1 TRINITY_DN5381_c0_g1~~TRINITY_DN5381_c0_g1_i2.p1  ORF type:complete len:322 (-),score=91.34 TRINITY_DN5381_c0_g1_i2:244-1209(-)
MSRDPSGTSLKQALRQMGLYEGDFDDYLQGQQRHAHVASGGSVAGSGSSGGIAQARSPPMLQGPKAAAHTSLKIVDVDASYYVLLVTGQLLPRPATDTAPAVEAQDAPCLLTDVEGRLVVTTATKLFLIPVSAISRVRSRLAGDPARGLRAEDSLGALKDHAIHRARAADLDALNSLDAAGLGRSPNLGPVLGPSATISSTSASSQMFGEGLDVSSGGPPLLPHHRHHVVSQHHRPMPQVQVQQHHQSLAPGAAAVVPAPPTATELHSGSEGDTQLLRSNGRGLPPLYRPPNAAVRSGSGLRGEAPLSRYGSLEMPVIEEQ